MPTHDCPHCGQTVQARHLHTHIAEQCPETRAQRAEDDYDQTTLGDLA